MRSMYVRLVMAVLFVLSFNVISQAQLSGTKTIPGDYATIAAAVTDLNAVGVGAGGVTFDVAAGHTESSTAQITITATGTSGNAIIFQKSGVGANPLVSRTDGGTNTTSAFGGLGDAIIRMNGSDYITFDGIDVSASSQGIEYGYFTHKPSGTDGSQNVTIKNSVITMTKGTSAYVNGIYISNGPTLVSSATGVTVTANSGRNENIVITGNTIQNVQTGVQLRGSSVSTAFYDQSPIVGQSGTGNTIQNFGGGNTATTYGIYMIYQSSANTSYNTINNTAGGGTNFTGTAYGIFHSTATDANGTYNNNTINLSSNTGQLRGITFGTAGTATHTCNSNSITLSMAGTSETACIYLAAAVSSVTINNNILSYGTLASTTTSYIIYASSTTPSVTVTGNQTSGAINKTGAGTFYGYYNLGSPTSGTETVSGNTFSNISLTGASTFTGINANTAAGQAQVISNNTVSNITGTSTNTITGIAAAGSGTRSVYGNLVFNLTGSGSIVGISSGAGGITATNFYKNKIYDLNSNSSGTTAGLVTGFLVSGGGAGAIAKVYNNLIGNLTAPSATGTDAIRGMSVTTATATFSIEFSYNTIYINASSSGANFGTTGIFSTGSTTSTTSNLTSRNNLVYNNSTASGTGLVAAFRQSSATAVNYNASSDRNLFYGGSPGSANLIYTNGTNSYDQLGDYQAFMSTLGADQNSVTEDVVFQSTTGSSADFLKFDVSAASLVESRGGNIVGITDDYIGTIRFGNPGSTSTGSAPDIGAWELEGIASGGCSGAPDPSNALTTSSSICSGDNFTLSLDVVFGIGFSFQWEASTTGPSSGFSPIGGATNATLLTSATVTTWYRAVVTCVASSTSTTSSSVQVTVPAALNGTYSIDNTNPTGGTNFNNFIDAVAALNCAGISGPVVFNVAAGQVFASNDSLRIFTTGTITNTVTFQRSGAGANPLVQRLGTGSTTNYILRLEGVDYYTFNGIDFEQTGSSSTDWVEYGITLINASTTNGAKNNTFKNGVVTMTNATVNAKGVYVQSSPTPTSLAGTNSDNRFINMNIQNSWEGYRFTGATSTFPDDGNEISTESGGSSMIQNLGDGSTTGSVYGVFNTYQTGLKIRNTEIMNLNAGGTSLVYGITLQTSTSNAAEISGNLIHDITGNGTVNGIHATSLDTADIFNNRIYALTTNTATSGAIRGIDLSATGAGVNIYSNQFYNISSAGLTTTTAGAIDVATGLVYNIYNNMISDIRAPGSTSTAAGTKGIAISGGSTGGQVRVYYNTVLLDDIGAASAYTSAALHLATTTPNVDVRNNILINKSDISTGTRVVAFWKSSTTNNLNAANDNNLFYAGSPDASHLLYYDATNSAQTIADIQAISYMGAREEFSVTEDVLFQAIVNGVIRPDVSTATLVESGGAEIADYDVDFENDPRGPYPPPPVNSTGDAPDIGADEGVFTFLAQPVPGCAENLVPTDASTGVCYTTDLSLTWTAPITGGPVTLGYDVYFGTSATPPFVTNTSSLSYTPTGLLNNTTYYWKIVPKGNSGDATGCATYSFTTADIAVTGTTGATRCGTGQVSISATGTGNMHWYNTLTGGSILFSGSPYTPNVTASTTFYVAAGTGLGVGRVGHSEAAAGTSGTTASTYGLCFNALTDITIDSVTIILNTTGGGTLVMQLRDSLTGSSGAGTFIRASKSITVPTGAVGDRIRIAVGFNVPQGEGYRLLAISSPSLIRTTTGTSYPYVSTNNSTTITSGFITNSGSASYYYFYDWQVTSGCESSPRQPVAVTVTPADPITITPSSVTRCPTDLPSSLTASSTYSYGNYTWSPATGLNTTIGATVEANPAATTTYTVTGDDGTCANTAQVTVTVSPVPINATASATANPACVGSAVNLSSSALFNAAYTINTACGTSFVDISGTGTSVTGTLGDDTEHNITIPSFNFNGVTYTTARVGVNGVVILGATTGENSSANAALPSTANSAGNIFLAPFWDDLDIQSGLTIKTQTVGSVFIIQWTNASHDAFTTGSVTFQVQLDLTSGVITYVYSDAVFGDVLYDNGVSATVGIQYSATTALQHSFNTASVNNGQCISFTPPSITYSWTGPNSFSSVVQNPSIPSVTLADAGTYTVTFTGPNGCSSSANFSLVVNETPTITLGTNPVVCAGATSASLAYTATTNSPNQYSVDYDASANAAGFVDVTNAALPTTPIVLVVPGAATSGIYNATLTVRNSSTGCTSSTSNPITVTINASPTITLGTNPTVCSGAVSANLPYTATTGIPDQYSIDFDATAEAAGFADVSLASLPSSPIVITVPGAAAAATYNAMLTVTNSSTGCASASTAITVTVVANSTPTVSISANPNGAICAGTSVEFTATAGGLGGGTVTYDFKVNGSSVQSGAANTYTTTSLANGDQVTVDISVSGGTCLTVTTASSNTITMTVNANLTPTVSIAANPGTTICAGTSVEFTATASNTGGGSVTYDFKVNGSSVQSGAGNTYTTTTLVNGDQVTVDISIAGGVCLNATTASSNTLTMTVNANVTPSVSIAANPAGAICAGTSVQFTATASNTGGGTVAYDFKVNGSSVQSGASNTYTTTTLANGDQVTVDISITGGACLNATTASSNTITMTVNANNTPTVSIAANPAGAICAGTSVEFTATASNAGGGTVTYDFKVNGSSVQSGASNTYTTTTLANGDQVTVEISVSGGTCMTATTATSNTITMTVNANVTPTVSIAANPAGAICAGTSVQFTATASNTGGGTVTYDFKVNGSSVQNGALNTYSTTTLANGDQVTVDISISGGTCLTATTASSNTITMTVNANNTPTVSIAANPAGAICTGTSVQFTATAGNVGGGTVNYDFKVNGSSVQSSASNTYTTSTLANGDQVTVEISVSGGTCMTATTATSNTITMTVTSTITPSVTIAANPAGAICAGTSVQFTASASSTGGGTVSYDFKVNGSSVQSGASNTYTTTTLANGDQVTVDISISGGSPCLTATTASSNTITMTVNANVTPTVSIAANPAGAICAGTSVQFTATASNTGGGTVTYDFKVNGSSVQSGALNTYGTTTLANGDQVTVDISISGGTCLTATTASSNTITMTVNANNTPTVSIAANPAGAICVGTSVQFTATAGNLGGGTASYDFKVNGSSVQSGASNTYTTTTLANGDQVTVEISVSGGTCMTATTATSNTITMTVTSTITPSVTIAANPSGAICAGTSVQFTASASSTGGGTVAYDFKVNGSSVQSGASNTYTTTTLANGDQVTVDISITGGSPCLTATTASSNTITMTVNANNTPTVTLTANPSGIQCSGTTIVFTATASNTGGGTVDYEFIINGTLAMTGVVGNTFTFQFNNPNIIIPVYANITVTGGTCLTSTTATSNTIQVDVDPAATVDANADQTVCAGSTVALNGNFGGSASSATWSGGAGTFTPNNTTMNAVYTPTATEISNGSVVLTLTTNDPAGPCDAVSDNMTITFTAASGVLAGTAGGPQVCKDMHVGTGATYSDASCNTIVKIVPAGVSPVSGMINGCVKIETTTPVNASNPYLVRHWDMTPASNPATATATVTLYFTPAEATTYNSNSTGFRPLPVNSGDNTSYTRVHIFHGDNGGGGIFDYPGSIDVITPTSVTWNSTNNWWEVSFDVTGFSGAFITTVVQTPLPVTFVSFSGYRNGNVNQLRWTTGSEQNNAGFEVRKSTDGVNYTVIGFVNSQAPGGNSSSELTYTFVDPNPSSKDFYQLRQVDLDNQSRYSNIVLIKGEKDLILSLDGLFPNPANTYVNVQITSPHREKVTLVILDMSGKPVGRKVVTVSMGNNTVPLDVARLAGGSYVVRMICSAGCESETAKFVKAY